jgi:hypothetical protein
VLSNSCASDRLRAQTARIVVGSVPRCTPAKVRTCDLSVRKTADINIRDVADDTSIYQPSAHIEAAGTGLGRIGEDSEAYVRSHVRQLEVLRRAGRSSASCAMRAASNGVSPRSAGRGCDGDLRPHPLVAMGPDRRHPVKARAVRAPGSAGLRP